MHGWMDGSVDAWTKGLIGGGWTKGRLASIPSMPESREAGQRVSGHKVPAEQIGHPPLKLLYVGPC